MNVITGAIVPSKNNHFICSCFILTCDHHLAIKSLDIRDRCFSEIFTYRSGSALDLKQ